MRPCRDAAHENAREIAMSFRPVTDRADDDEVSRLAQLHACDAPRELQVCLHAVERRLVRRGDQDRVDVSVARPCCGRQRMAGAGDRLAPEGEVAIVELELVQLRTRSSARVAAAINSGPTPSPARQATVFTFTLRTS